MGVDLGLDLTLGGSWPWVGAALTVGPYMYTRVQERRGEAVIEKGAHSLTDILHLRVAWFGKHDLEGNPLMGQKSGNCFFTNESETQKAVPFQSFETQCPAPFQSGECSSRSLSSPTLKRRR